jgi:hypothetical protein
MSAQPTPVQPRPIAIAPATANSNGKATPQDEESPTPTMNFTCVTCARRKVKCSKTGPPCTSCNRSKLECHYEAPPPRKRKRKPVDDVTDKLERYEKVLKEHNLLSKAYEDSPENPPPDIKHFPLGIPWPNNRGGKLLSGHGKSRYIDSTLWKNLGEEELNPSSEEEENADQDDPAIPSPAVAHDPVSAQLMNGVPTQRSLLDYHPTYDVAMKLWKTYCTHVEPITKLLHVPTIQTLVLRAAANPSTASKATECLQFVIYHFAVVAMSEKEGMDLLGQPRSACLTRFHDAARQALVNAHFLRTSELMVLQAFISFLLSVRGTYDPHTFWVLTGVAVRIGQRMGLHRDGEVLGLNPFDVEVRRRVFWQLLPLDGMAAQVSGTGIALPYDSWDTKEALNVNDADIWPDMTEKPIQRVGATDMMFCLCRAEIGKFHQKGKPFLGTWGRLWDSGDISAITELEKAIDNLETTLEENFFRYCDFVEPLHCLTLAMGRGALTNARLRLRLPALKINEEGQEGEREQIWNMALKVLDYAISVLSNPLLQRYAWHLRSFFQWDPLIWVLSEIRKGASVVTDPGAVWQKIDQMFEVYPHITKKPRALNVAICKLTVRTWDTQPYKGLPVPVFVDQFRCFLTKREGSSQDSTPNNTALIDPQLSVGSSSTWSPQNYSANQPMQDWSHPGAHPDAFPATMIDECNPEPFDWTFWDHLMRDPDSYPNINIPPM